MIRVGMMLAAAVLMSAAGGMAYAKMAMQTYSVLAGAVALDCLSRAGRYSLVHRAIRRQTRSARSPGPASRM